MGDRGLVAFDGELPEETIRNGSLKTPMTLETAQRQSFPLVENTSPKQRVKTYSICHSPDNRSESYEQSDIVRSHRVHVSGVKTRVCGVARVCC